MADKRHSDRRRTDDPEAQANRLAELVAELTGTPPGAALHAVRTERAEQTDRDALEVVANAMVNVDRPPPPGFRLAGYVRDDESSDREPPAG